ncbi:MAG: type IV pilus assembly protein PilM [Thermodesulforhabdaceae bacterium]
MGLDVGSHAAKVLQLKQTKQGFLVKSIGMAQYPAGSFEGPHIANMKAVGATVLKLWQNLGLKDKKVALCAPGNEVITEMPQIPPMKRAAVFSYIDSNVRDFIMYSPDEVFYGVDILSENPQDGSYTVLIAYTRRGVLYDYEKLMNIAGLDLSLVDVDYFALFNAFEATEAIPSEETMALVDIGASKTIVVCIQDKLPVFTKSFLVGTNELIFQVMDKFGLSYYEAHRVVSGTIEEGMITVPHEEVKIVVEFFIDQVVAELNNLFDYFQNINRGNKIRRIFLSGGIARSPGVAFQFEKSFGIPVFVFNPLASEKVQLESYIDPDYAKAIGPQMAVCFGLALRQEENGKK